MSFWLQVVPLQSKPFDMGVDVSGRATYGFNVMVTRLKPSVSAEMFAREVAAVLVAASIGSAGVNIYSGQNAAIPEGPGPFLSIVETGGPAGYRTHNRAGTSYERATASVAVRADDSEVAIEMASAALAALEVVTNTTVTPVF